MEPMKFTLYWIPIETIYVIKMCLLLESEGKQDMGNMYYIVINFVAVHDWFLFTLKVMKKHSMILLQVIRMWYFTCPREPEKYILIVGLTSTKNIQSRNRRKKCK